MVRDLGNRSIAEIAASTADCVRAEMLAGCNLLRLAHAWALKHPGDGLPYQVKLVNGADERRLMVAGDGTPDIAEGASADFGLEARLSPAQATALIADALDLAYRYPCLWARIESGSVPAWQARHLAQKTRHLTIDQAGSIDRCIVGHLGNLSRTRLDNLINAEILRVDQEAREEAAKKALKDRDIQFGRPDDNNMVDFWGSLPANDAFRSDASIDHLADILIGRRDDLPAGVPARGAQSKTEWRSVALALFTNNPVLALQLLMEDQRPDLFNGIEPGSDEPDCDEPDRLPEIVKDVVRQIDASKLVPTETLNIHISAGAFSKPEEAIGRVEKIGPALLSTIQSWLGEACAIRLQPVLDPDGITPVDRYETPDRIRDALLARTPASVFPWTGSVNRRNDLDHSVPYLPPPSGPPGQTGLHNLGPLTRREHRAKTIGHMSLRQPDPGSYVWKTRYGRVLITNDTGTHDLGTGELALQVWHTADRMQHLHALDVA